MSAPAVYRYEVPVDDRWHVLELTGDILHVASRSPEVVEFWALANQDPPVRHRLRVFGTGHLGFGTGAAACRQRYYEWFRQPGDRDEYASWLLRQDLLRRAGEA